jgi:hypothetical protein
MNEEEFLALYDALPVPDPAKSARLAASGKKQEVARAAEESEEYLREPSLREKAASFAQGAADSVSMGLAPAVRGTVAAVAPLALGGLAVATDKPIAGMGERYRAARDDQKDKMAAAGEGKLGGAYGSGHLTADAANALLALAAPAKSAAMAAEDLMAGAKVKDVVSTGLAPVANALRGAAARALGKMGENADELRVLTTMGAQGGSINAPAVLREAERVPGGVPELAKQLRETGISKGITTTGGIAKRAAALQESSGKAIGRMIDEAAQSGGYVDTKNLATRLRAEAAMAEAEAGAANMSDVANRHSEKLLELADRLEKSAPGGVMMIDRVKKMSVALGDDAAGAYAARAGDRAVAGTGRALMDTRRLTEGAIGETIVDLGLDRAAYEAAKRQNQVSRIASEAAEASLGRAGKNNLIGLTTATLAQTNPGAAIVHQVLKPLQSSARATWAETARDLAKTLEQPEAMKALGPAGPELQAAAAQGGSQLKAVFDRLLREDPTLRNIMAGARVVGGVGDLPDDDLDVAARERAARRQ